jgi:hypothetical protein
VDLGPATVVRLESPLAHGLTPDILDLIQRPGGIRPPYARHA